jgi:hypothetical protein
MVKKRFQFYDDHARRFEAHNERGHYFKTLYEQSYK